MMEICALTVNSVSSSRCFRLLLQGLSMWLADILSAVALQQTSSKMCVYIETMRDGIHHSRRTHKTGAAFKLQAIPRARWVGKNRFRRFGFRT